ncbi:MAG: MarC family protein [Acidiferrobacterales bacterium]
MTVYSAALLLFLVMDPIGNIPFFLTTLKNVDPAKQRRIIVRELLIALAVLVFFLFAGQLILDVLQISEPSLSIAGGIILFLIAIRMIFASPEGIFNTELQGEPFIVPLAIPFVAGPSALAAVLLIRSREPDRWLEWLAALVGAWLVTGVILYLSSGFSRVLGERGLIAVERLMGMILTVVAVQMFMTGISLFFERS